MIKWIKAALDRRLAAAEKRLEARGWDWAAGELLRGAPVDYIESYTSCNQDRNAFDVGAEKAIYAWTEAMLHG